MPYHTPTYKVLEELSVDPNVGVCPDEIEDRRRQFGANVFETQQKSSITQLFFEQIKDPMIIILLCAASVSLLLQEVIDSCIIVLVIVLNALIG
ncbi:MAG: cation-transporting P-type ATPase, partial [Merdibacter sp.]|nr:cation-transporting P-type ATPase [Merdibacter sp.]